MTRLVVRLLGGFRVDLDRDPVYGFETDKARALLAYLIVEADRPHRRETLAGLLWPDRPDATARNSLRHTLFRVRQALAGHDTLGRERAPFLFVTPMDVQFNTASDYSLDVAELESLARRDLAHSPAGGPGRHDQLLPEIFCGEFLAGFSMPDSEAFEAWMLNKQEYYHRLTLEVLDAQNAAFEGFGDYERAVAATRLELKLEPWLEEAHRRCMRGLALVGRRDEALRQYDACCRALQAELGVEPAASTQELYAAIRTGKPLATPRATAAGPRAAAPGQPAAGSATRPRPAGQREATALPTRPPVRLVARENELEQLNRHLAAALRGEAGVAFVSGDPGSGKTALVEAFAASAMRAHSDLLVVGARCSPPDETDPLAPLRKLAEMLFGDLADELAWRLPGREQVDRLQRATDLALAALDEHGAGLLGTLVPAASVSRRAGLSVGLPDPGSAPQPTRSILFDQLTRTLAAIARRQPLLLLLDDLHWVDDATAAFLLHLGRELTASRVLVLGAYRSTAVSQGRRDPRTGEVSRHPMMEVINEQRCARGEITVDLDRGDGRAFVEAYVDTEPNRLGARFRDALYTQTDGHALFTIELLHGLQGQGELVKDEVGRWNARESLAWRALPARVEAAIAERIDRLPAAERRILSAASVQGDDFSAEMVAELTGLPLGEVIAALSSSLARQHRLVRPEGLQRASAKPRVGSARSSIYRFAHHLFQKYLYDELDPIERAQMHAGVATSLDRQSQDDPGHRERVSARLAWHYEQGGLPLEAARALLDAGRDAQRLSAYREALERYDHGLALLESEPPSKARNEIERLLDVARLAPQRNLDGMGSAGVQRGLLRATEAFARGGEAPTGDVEGRPKRLMLLAETQHLMGTGKLEDALAAAERLRAEAEQYGEEDLVAAALVYLGLTLHHMGRPVESERQLNSAVDLGMQERLAGARAATGVSPVPSGLGYSALNWWFFGYADRAVARSAEAIGRAVESGDRFGQVTATVTGAILHFLLGDSAVCAECCEQGHRVCVECGIGWWRALFDVLLARLPIAAAPKEEAIERMRKGIAEWQGVGMAMGMDLLTLVFADGCMAAAEQCVGRDDARRNELLSDALAALDSALGPAKFAYGQMHEAELLRLRGELLLVRDGLVAAEEALECFRQAMQLGRDKGALAWELRAAMSVVRLRERQIGQGVAELAALGEARNCLATVYRKFTEGFTFPDLQEASVLIQKMM